MGKCTEGYTLERIDNLKNYSKDNCIWADTTTQVKNRGSFNDYVTYNGKTMVLKDWAKEFGIKYTTLYQRIYRSGLTFEEAIQKDPFNKLIQIGEESKPMKEWCQIYNIDFKLVNNRINKYNWDPLEALTIPKGQTRKEFNKKNNKNKIQSELYRNIESCLKQNNTIDDKFSQIASNFYSVLKESINMRPDLKVCVLTHSENTGDSVNPSYKIKTVGK